MTPTQIEVAMSVFGVITATQLVPACYRIWYRRSSDDFSLWSMGIALVTQILWLLYAIYASITCLIIGSIAWLIALFTMTGLILRYRNKEKL